MSLSQLPQQIVFGLGLGAIYALVAIGFSLIYRTMGLLSFVHPQFVMLGSVFGYTALVTFDDFQSLAALGRPLLVGPSRKSYLKAAIGDREAADRDWATAAAVTAAVLLGAHIVRVHSVKEMADVVRTADAIRAAAERST